MVRWLEAWQERKGQGRKPEDRWRIKTRILSSSEIRQRFLEDKVFVLIFNNTTLV